jgi:hypothetical protein
MDVFLDVESDQRDPKKYPHANDYVIKLNRELYDVTKIKLIAARIPFSQTIINDYNNTFSINDTTVTLENRNFSDGFELANVLGDTLSTTLNSNVSSVNFDSNTNALTFSNAYPGGSNSFALNFYSGTNGYNVKNDYGTPSSVFGFNHNDVTSDSDNTLTGGVIDLCGPTSLVIRITTNSNDLKKNVYNVGTSNVGLLDYTESVYFGRIVTDKDHQKNILIYTNQYPIEEDFQKGPEKSIKELRIRFYYTLGTKLVPYSFGSRNHTLKFKITCALDKRSTLEKQKVYRNKLPPPIKLPKLEPGLRTNKKSIINVLFILLTFGFVMLLFFKQPEIKI